MQPARLLARVPAQQRDQAIDLLNNEFGQIAVSQGREPDIVLIVIEMGHGPVEDVNLALRKRVKRTLSESGVAVSFPEFEEESDPPPTRL